MKTAIIFDLDGTLWDASGSFSMIWNRVLARYEAVDFTMTHEIGKSLMGTTMEEIGARLFPDLALETRNEILVEVSKDEVAYLREHGAVLYEGVEETVAALSREYNLYIVSNCQDGYIAAFLYAHKLRPYFTDMEMSGRTGREKTENIRILMERNRIGDAVYVGDTEIDEKAARNVGLPFIFAAYGFGCCESPDGVIGSIRELPACLKRITDEKS